jgi:hypothetical protein
MESIIIHHGLVTRMWLDAHMRKITPPRAMTGTVKDRLHSSLWVLIQNPKPTTSSASICPRKSRARKLHREVICHEISKQSLFAYVRMLVLWTRNYDEVKQLPRPIPHQCARNWEAMQDIQRSECTGYKQQTENDETNPKNFRQNASLRGKKQRECKVKWWGKCTSAIRRRNGVKWS